MTAIKINPARLPYRGEPTKDRRPVLAVPDGAAIIMVDKIREPVKQARDWAGRHRKDLWTEEQDKTAWDMLIAGEDIADIAKSIGRGYRATYARLCRIRKEKGEKIVIKKRSDRYTPEEDKTIIHMHNKGKSAKEIGKLIGKPHTSIKSQTCYLRKLGYTLIDQRKG